MSSKPNIGELIARTEQSIAKSLNEQLEGLRGPLSEVGMVVTSCAVDLASLTAGHPPRPIETFITDVRLTVIVSNRTPANY